MIIYFKLKRKFEGHLRPSLDGWSSKRKGVFAYNLFTICLLNVKKSYNHPHHLLQLFSDHLHQLKIKFKIFASQSSIFFGI
jgi:hypothetical protein